MIILEQNFQTDALKKQIALLEKVQEKHMEDGDIEKAQQVSHTILTMLNKLDQK